MSFFDRSVRRPGVKWALALLSCSWGCARAHYYYLCAGEKECGVDSACVAGLCLRRGTVPAFEGARRWVLSPVEVACAAEPEIAECGAAETVSFGRADGAATVLLRFAVALPPESRVLEAFVLLDRASDIEVDPAPIFLHAERVVSPWNGASVARSPRPRLRDAGLPWTKVMPSGPQTVRIDVRSVIADVSRSDREGLAAGRELGIGIVAQGSSFTGLAFALASGRHGRGPRLELYVK